MWFIRHGSRVTGPHTEAELGNMREIGTFGPTFQISADRLYWESAAPLCKKLDALQRAQLKRSTTSASAPLTGTSSGVYPRPPGRWYYADEHGQQVGPAAADAIRDLFTARRVHRRTLVCREGKAVWGELRHQQEFQSWLPKPRYPLFASACGGAVAAVLLAIVFVAMRWPDTHAEAQPKKGDSPADPTPGSQTATAKGLITNLEDEAQIAQATGFVVVGDRVELENGAVIEGAGLDLLQRSYGMGSCFAVTPTGYLLTNHHVAGSDSSSQNNHRHLDKDLARRAGLTGPALKSDSSKVVVSADTKRIVLVYFEGVRFEAEVIEDSTRFDLAILKISPPRPIPYFALSARSKFNRGAIVVALGYPGIAAQPLDGSVEAMAISLQSHKSKSEAILRRETSRIDSILQKDMYAYSASHGAIKRMASFEGGAAVIQHSAEIFSGNSGGPLVDSQGAVIAINTWRRPDFVEDKLRSSDTVYMSAIVSQFRSEVDRFVPGVVWVE